MFKHLLVPLDGSTLAESVLPAAAYLAETLDASVTLIHVIEEDAPQEIHGERHLSEPGEARSYLEALAGSFPSGVAVESHVHTLPSRDVAKGIVEHVDEFSPDLIVMCTHGRGGLRGLVVGSIAQQVITLGNTPVLLIQPGKEEPQPQSPAAPLPILGEGAQRWGPLRRILVPLDGNADHEQGLVVAAGLAASCQSEIHLLMVVPTTDTLTWESAATARMLPGMTDALLDLAQKDAVSYLRERMAGLRSSGLKVSAEVQRGDPTEIIVKTARRVDAQLIALGTHGRRQMDAFWSGSVTPKVASRTHLPLLLVPVPESKPER